MSGKEERVKFAKSPSIIARRLAISETVATVRRMGNALRNDYYISPDEYLLGEELSVDKHEYLNGVVYMMAGASAGHDRITMNISGELHALLRGKPCEAFSADTRVHVRTETAEFYYYPDVTVDCTGRANDSRYSESPRVIFEVLSPATERVDRGEKLQNYQRLASLEAYVLVDQLRVAVTTYRRTTTGWETELLVEKDDVLALGCVDCQLPLTAIYERTGL